MRRFLILALIAVFALGTAGWALAGEVDMQAKFQQTFEWTDNTDFFDYDHETADQSEDDFDARQRARIYFHYVANENLKGVFGIESNNDWGDDTAATGGSLGANPTSLSLEDCYLDFNLPGTSFHVRSGMHGFAPPSTMGSPIWDDDVFGVSTSYSFSEQVSMSLAWHRLYDRTLNNDPVAGRSENDEVDAFFLSVPVSMDGFSLTPYAMYVHHGADALAFNGNSINNAGLQNGNSTALGDDLDIWWGGAAFTMDMFDPFIVMADVIYGSVDGGNSSDNDRSGWFFDLGVDYKMDMVTPGLFFFWGSGDDDDQSDGGEAMPSLGGAFEPTSFGFDGTKGDYKGTDELLGDDNYGMWGVGAKLADFSFLENISHTIRVMYGQGTNSADLAKKGYATGLTTKDNFWEVNVDSAYSMYENLTAYLEIGYLALDLDEEPWKNSNTGVWDGDPDDTDDAWKCSFTLKYQF